jgi:hypothetical protein
VQTTASVELQPVTLIASEGLLQRHSLVRGLEKQHVALIERTLRDPVDIIFDDRVCMTIRPAEVLSSDEEARALVNSILALASFEKCWLIFTLRSDGAR